MSTQPFLFDLPPPPQGDLSASERALMAARGCDPEMMRAAACFEGEGRARVILFFCDFVRRGPRLLAKFRAAALRLARMKRAGRFGSEWMRAVAKIALLAESAKRGEPPESLANTLTPRFYVSLARRYLPPAIAARVRCDFPLAEMLWSIWAPRSVKGGPRRD